MIEVSMNAVYVTILLDCILHELIEVGPKCGNGCLAVRGGKPRDGFVHERSNDFWFTVDNEFVVLSIGEQSCLGLFSEAVLQTAPHLFVVLCHLFVCVDACGKDERLAPVLNVPASICPYSTMRLTCLLSLFVNLRMFWAPLSHPIMLALSCSSFSKITT